MKRVLVVLSALLWSTQAFAQQADPFDDALQPDPRLASPPAPPVASSPPLASSPPAEQAAPSTGPRADLFEVSAGMRQNYLRSAGFDPFSENDVLTQGTVAAAVPVFHRGKLALAVGAAYSGGGSTATIRGDATHLSVYEISALIEGRFHFAPWAFAFARVAPGATGMTATVTDPSSPADIASTRWAFSTDLSAGAAVLLGPRSPDSADKRTPRLWLLPEIGYGFSTKTTFDARPDRDQKDVLGGDERVALPALSTNALFWRVTLAATF